MDIIEVNHVSKSFGQEQVLFDVTHSIEKGKIHGIVGNNGSGKTVLLASHNQIDIDELYDTVCEMDGGVLTVIREN